MLEALLSRVPSQVKPSATPRSLASGSSHHSIVTRIQFIQYYRFVLYQGPIARILTGIKPRAYNQQFQCNLFGPKGIHDFEIAILDLQTLKIIDRIKSEHRVTNLHRIYTGQGDSCLVAALGNWTLAFNLLNVKERKVVQSYAGFAEGYPWSFSYVGKDSAQNSTSELVVSYFYKNTSTNSFEAHCDTLIINHDTNAHITLVQGSPLQLHGGSTFCEYSQDLLLYGKDRELVLFDRLTASEIIVVPNCSFTGQWKVIIPILRGPYRNSDGSVIEPREASLYPMSRVFLAMDKQ